MPTIEIVSVGSKEVPDLPCYDGFAYIAEGGVVSHRGLFQKELDKNDGIIVHLANKEFEGEEDEGWFAGGIMNWDDDSGFDPVVFEKHRFPDVIDLLERLIVESPCSEVIFLTDYQFGPEKSEVAENSISMPEFVDLHTQRKLRYNKLYRIRNISSNKSSEAMAFIAAPPICVQQKK